MKPVQYTDKSEINKKQVKWNQKLRRKPLL
jgi:hypothetical protein